MPKRKHSSRTKNIRCKLNHSILNQLKFNDPTFSKLWICHEDGDDCDYWPINEMELIALGTQLGKNVTVEELSITSNPVRPYYTNTEIEKFRIGLGRNQSINKLVLEGIDLYKIFSTFDMFFKNNTTLTELEIMECEFGVEGNQVRQLSLALGNRSKTLKSIRLIDNIFQEGQSCVTEIIRAMSMHPQLETIELVGMSIGTRNEYKALGTLLKWNTTNLKSLDLSINDIDDEGVESITKALSGSNGSKLEHLNLSCNELITVRGWKTLSKLLQMPECNLRGLYINNHENIGNEGARIFAKALIGNNKLKHLWMIGNGITSEGQKPFANLLCDTSTINNTYLSNHTLVDIGIMGTNMLGITADIRTYLQLNSSSQNKGHIAMMKILQHHTHFDMQPFFHLEFKVLPHVIGWLEKASTLSIATNFRPKIKHTKLSIMYDFVREFPMLYVESSTKHELKQYSALEKKLRENQIYLTSKLEQCQRCGGDRAIIIEKELHLRLQLEELQLKKLQQCKTRAMRRLSGNAICVMEEQ